MMTVDLFSHVVIHIFTFKNLIAQVEPACRQSHFIIVSRSSEAIVDLWILGWSSNIICLIRISHRGTNTWKQANMWFVYIYVQSKWKSKHFIPGTCGRIRQDVSKNSGLHVSIFGSINSIKADNEKRQTQRWWFHVQNSNKISTFTFPCQNFDKNKAWKSPKMLEKTKKGVEISLRGSLVPFLHSAFTTRRKKKTGIWNDWWLNSTWVSGGSYCLCWLTVALKQDYR